MNRIDSLVSDRSQAAFIRSVISSANRCCNTEPLTVVNKSKCQSGNVHNFESLSIYFWPDTINPNGPYICRDGYFNPEYKQYDLPKLIEFTNRIKTLSLAYCFSNNSKYAVRCLQELRVWFIDEESYMTPTFEYAQLAPGHWNGKGAAVGLVDAYYFIDIVESIRLMQQKGFVTKEDDVALRAWFMSFLDWAVTSENGRAISAKPDNVSTAYDVLVYSIASYVGSKKIQKSVINRFATNHIANKIDSEGRQIEELKRPTAMTYSILNLKHLLDFYILLRNTNNKYSNDDWKKVCAAAIYLNGFVGHKDKFGHKELNDWNALEKKMTIQMSRLYRLEPNMHKETIEKNKIAKLHYDVSNVTE